MGLVDWLFGTSASGAGELLEGAGKAAVSIREAITGHAVLTAEQNVELAKQAATLEAQLNEAANRVNEAEARSGSVFVAGWRPFIGWICGFGLGYHFLFRPIVTPFMPVGPNWPPFPPIDNATLTTLLLAMLGMAGARTVEKIKGVNEEHA